MVRSSQRGIIALCLRVIAGVSRIVPVRWRAPWREEWETELLHRWQKWQEWNRATWRNRMKLLKRTLGAVADAVWLRQQFTFNLDFMQDVRFGLRQLRKNPGFTTVAVLTLALGLGANTAIFSVVNAVLFRPLPVNDPEEIVVLHSKDTSDPSLKKFSYPDYLDLRERADSLTELASYTTTTLSLSTGRQAERIRGELVSGNYFDVLRAPLRLGRNFKPEENQTPNTHPVAILSYNLWRRAFGGDPAAVGQTVLLNNRSYTIVGVAERNFGGVNIQGPADAWIPMMMLPHTTPGLGSYLLNFRKAAWLNVLGRLQPGVTVEQAETGLSNRVRILDQEHARKTTRALVVTPELQARIPPGQQRAFANFSALLMTAVALVLLIACANIAGLLLTRSAQRRKEIAVRAALGASPWRIFRQNLTESFVLATLGVALGLPMGMILTRLLPGFVLPAGIPIAELDLRMDIHVFAYLILLAALATLVFGLIPAVRYSRSNPAVALRDHGRESGPRRRLPHFLVVAGQVAVSVVLLAGAGLLVRTVRNMESFDMGFTTENVHTFSMDLNLQGYSKETGSVLVRELLEKIRNVPGVEAATGTQFLPLDDSSFAITFYPEDRTLPEEDAETRMMIVSSGYFETIRLPIVSGRGLTEQDREGTAPVAVINQTMARRHWPGSTPIGKRISISGPEGPYMEVVGVARDSKYSSLREEASPFVYLPFGQHHSSSLSFLLRTSLSSDQALPLAVHEARSLDPNLPLFQVGSLSEAISFATAEERMAATLLSAFALVSVILTAVGLYGLLASSASSRTHEIGIRMALGARSGNIVGLILRQGMLLTVAGLGIGVAGSFFLTHFVDSLLFGLSTMDPLTHVAVAVLLAGVAMLACYIPARRASKVDPMVALRYE